MAELWDILDENGEKKGKTIARGEPLQAGEFFLAVHIWIRGSDGRYLIQRRVPGKQPWPHMWAATGGAVLAGETSLRGALRETAEEMGVAAQAENMTLLTRLKRKDFFTDIWLLRQDAALQSLTLQPEEVCDAKWADADEIRRMIAAGEFVGYSYTDLVFSQP